MRASSGVTTASRNAAAERAITYRYGRSTYEIAVEDPGAIRGDAAEVEVDGRIVVGTVITLVDDGVPHAVSVRPRRSGALG